MEEISENLLLWKNSDAGKGFLGKDRPTLPVIPDMRCFRAVLELPYKESNFFGKCL